MAIPLVSSILGFFRKCSGDTSDTEIPVIRRAHWNSLPNELLQLILNLVCDPTRTAFVNRNFYAQSQHSYTVLLQRYEGYPSLKQLIPTVMKPAQKVQAVYLFIINEARSYGINLKGIEPKLLPLDPERLAKIRELTIPRLYDKYYVYRAIFHQTNSEFTQKLNQMTMQGVIEFAETSLKTRDTLYSPRPNKLDLGYCHLTHLPPLIGQLKALNNLNLHDNELTFLPIEMKSLIKLTTLHLNGNPLLSKNVKEVCQSLPSLKTVFIDNEQPHLKEMFQTHFPNLKVQIVQILRLEEEI